MTVFGESAGGLDILMLMTGRSSSQPNDTPTLSEARKAGTAIATKLGAANAQQLRSLPADAFKDIDE